MKKILFLTLGIASCATSFAQVADGYYRVKNVGSDRYLYVTDNQGYARLQGTDLVHDLDAIILRKGLDNCITDPSSILYVKRNGTTNKYDLYSQGTSVKEMAEGHTIMIDPKSGYYTVGTTEKGFNAYLGDVTTNNYEYGKIDTKAKDKFNLWNPISVKSSTDNYFAVNTNISYNSQYYTTLFADFGFQPAGKGMHVFSISKVDEANGLVCMTEINGIVPNSTPVIISSDTDVFSDNRLDLHYSKASLSVVNKLSGNYFNYNNQFLLEGKIPEAKPGYERFYKYSVKPHNSQKDYDPSTMRILGLTSDGKLAFKKMTKEECPYLPANQAYLVVSPNAPDNLLVLSEEEYNASTRIDVLDAGTKTAVTYNLLGKVVENTDNLPAGIYIIGGKKMVIR